MISMRNGCSRGINSGSNGRKVRLKKIKSCSYDRNLDFLPHGLETLYLWSPWFNRPLDNLPSTLKVLTLRCLRYDGPMHCLPQLTSLSLETTSPFNYSSEDYSASPQFPLSIIADLHSISELSILPTKLSFRTNDSQDNMSIKRIQWRDNSTHSLRWTLPHKTRPKLPIFPTELMVEKSRQCLHYKMKSRDAYGLSWQLYMLSIRKCYRWSRRMCSPYSQVLLPQGRQTQRQR